MKFEIGYSMNKKTKIITVETAQDAHETVYIVYENDSYTFMTSSLFALLQFARNQYDDDTFEMFKLEFQ